MKLLENMKNNRDFSQVLKTQSEVRIGELKQIIHNSKHKSVKIFK
jgi:heat shock protein HslJ